MTQGNVLQIGEHSSGGLRGSQIAQLANNYKLTPATLMAEVAEWWLPAPFLQYIAAEIASAIARAEQTGVGCGLLVSAPPRHGKSKLITVATPLWVLENFPTKNVIVATYGEDLSTDFTREVKGIIKAHPDKLSVRIRRDVDRAQNFVTPQGGGLKAVGLRGTITGRGANVLIIDDYIKEPKEALNHAYLESLKTWYATVARTRLEPGAVVIIVATRWVTNDLHGHLERLESRRTRPFYKIIKIPAISGLKVDGEWVPNPKLPDILGRKPGEPLFPARYNRDQLEDIIDELGMRWFQAMFQQDPASEEGGITNPDNLRIISKKEFELLLEQKKAGLINGRKLTSKWGRSWDFAGTKDAGDFTCGFAGMYDTETQELFIIGGPHGQYSSGHVQTIYVSNNETDDPDWEYIIEQEPGSAGIMAAETWKNLAARRKVHVVKSVSEGSKLLKAQPFIAATERKQIVLVVDDPKELNLTPWAIRLIDQFAMFPEAPHDDIMDSVCNLYTRLSGKKFVGGSFGRSQRAKDALERLKAGDGSLASIGAPPVRHRVTFGRAQAGSARPKKLGFNISGRR